MGQFYFFASKKELLPLLKKEVAVRFPFLNFSFSSENFIFYRTNTAVSNLKASVSKACLSFYQGPMLFKFSLGNLRPLENLNFKNILFLGDSFLAINSQEMKDQILSLYSSNIVSDSSSYLVAYLSKGHLYLGMIKQDDYSSLNSFFEKSPFVQNPKAPSRAYLKALEYLEVLKEQGLKLSAETEVIEMGSSPGGASFALCEVGYKVLGIDPGDMSETLSLFSNLFYHQKMSMQKFSKEYWDFFLKAPQLLFCDVNLRPLEVLEYLNFFIDDFLENGGKALVWTLKLTDWRHLDGFFKKDWPIVEEELRQMGARKIVVRTVPSHHKEFLVLALF